MRSSALNLLSHGHGEPIMSHPDYEQHAHHHGCLLVLVRGIGQLKPRSLQKVFERIQRVNNVQVTDSTGNVRDIWIRYIRDHPVENNDWGDFQTHRRLLGLITVGKFDTQLELNELCRVHESLKVKYTNTLYDSLSILYGPSRENRLTSTSNGNISNISSSSNQSQQTTNKTNPPASDLSLSDKESSLGSLSSSGVISLNSDIMASMEHHVNQLKLEEQFQTPTNFKSRALFYHENDLSANLETNVIEFINSLFWILESKRLERTKEKIDRVALLLAPFEKKDFVGLDMESRNNKKRCIGRVTKHLGDLTLQAGLVAESLNLFHAASETLRAISDSLWLGAANEGLCAASAILLYPNIRNTLSFHRNCSLPDGTSPQKLRIATSLHQENSMKNARNRKSGLAINLTSSNSVVTANDSSTSSSASSVASSLSSATSGSGADNSTSSNEMDPQKTLAAVKPQQNLYPSNILTPDDITTRYRDAIINYSKYRNAGIIETEAALKAARICIEQQQNLDVAMFLQNVLYINLNMNEQERVRRFEMLTELYQQIGYNRKAAFCQRLAAWRHVAQSNTNPDWGQSYRLMLDSFSGHKLALEPTEVILNNTGWPVLQIDLLQQLVAAARRLGQSALATRHMTFLLQTMWKHLTANEQKEMALQLQNLSAQCEGAPVPLVLENGTMIPPANLTDLPFCQQLQLKNIATYLRPFKIKPKLVDSGPFLFTPIHFNSQDRGRITRKRDVNRLTFTWVQNDLSEVTIKLMNPLQFELQVSDMRLLTTGIVFESLPQTVTLQPNVVTSVTLHGTPLEVGELEVLGYSTHTLGVKSNCRLKNMLNRDMPPSFLIEVVPALPRLDVKTSLPQTATFGGSATDNVLTAASLSLYNGETAEVTITLTNTSQIPIEMIETSLQSNLDATLQNRLFNIGQAEIQSKLPLLPQQSMDFKVEIYGEADFLGPIHAGPVAASGAGGMYSQSPNNLMVHDGPHSFNMSMGAPNSIQSRMSSPNNTLRRNDMNNSSFRSTQSGHSSLATLSLGMSTGHATRQLDVQLRLKFSGGEALRTDYCRQCAIAFSLELLPSAQITSWDVLPAEIPSQFYLVLDVVNLTAQEMCLNYTSQKNILIEAKESCRVPVPVERCPIDRLLSAAEEIAGGDNVDTHFSILSGIDLSERVCSDHISNLVNLKWTLPATETNGVAKLRGISLSPTMLDLVTVAPLQWDVKINQQSVAPQSEVTCCAGQSIQLAISICNLSAMPLTHLTLTIQFYQDYQNGVHNYRLDTRCTMSGTNQIKIPYLNRNEKASHECSVLFFTPGRFKADIQCRSLNSTTPHMNDCQAHSTSTTQHGLIALNNNETHIWRFIPPVEITVVEF